MRKNIIRITESDLHNIIVNTVKRVLKEDVLGNDWNAIDDNENFNVNNNYEVFKNQDEHNFSGQGEEGIDPTYQEPRHDDAIAWNEEEI